MLLAGLVQAPTRDDPLTAPRAARARMTDVFSALVCTGSVTAALAGKVDSLVLALRSGKKLPGADVSAGSFTVGAAFAWPGLVGAGVLLLAGLFSPAVGRHLGRLADGVWWIRLLRATCVLAAFVLFVRSFRVA